MVQNMPKFNVSTQGNMRGALEQFKFKGPAPTATRWGRLTPRFGRPPLGLFGPRLPWVGSQGCGLGDPWVHGHYFSGEDVWNHSPLT
jgi:hypothetical protein